MTIERLRAIRKVTGNTLKVWLKMYDDPHHIEEQRQKILEVIQRKIQCHQNAQKDVENHIDYKCGK